MAELSKRWIIDADIIVDYQNKTLSFENELSALTAKSLTLTIGAILPVLVIVVRNLGVDSILIGVFWTVYILAARLSSGMPSIHRKLTFKFRKKIRKSITLSNPEETVIYETRNTSPLIDIEYSDDIADALMEITLRKGKRGRFLRIFTRTIQVLTITLSRKAFGALKIIEY